MTKFPQMKSLLGATNLDISPVINPIKETLFQIGLETFARLFGFVVKVGD